MKMTMPRKTWLVRKDGMTRLGEVLLLPHHRRGPNYPRHVNLHALTEPITKDESFLHGRNSSRIAQGERARSQE